GPVPRADGGARQAERAHGQGVHVGDQALPPPHRLPGDDAPGAGAVGTCLGVTAPTPRMTQADRRARSRAALPEAPARGISKVGYGHLVLADVAADAGYTRGALYHQFADKDALVLATLDWVRTTWLEEVGTVFDEDLAPVEAVAELARRHAIYCR